MAEKGLLLSTTNSAAILLPQYTAWPENIRWTCPSGWWLSSCSHFLSICPRTPRSTSARATACARKRAFGNRVAAGPKLAPDRRFAVYMTYRDLVMAALSWWQLVCDF